MDNDTIHESNTVCLVGMCMPVRPQLSIASISHEGQQYMPSTIQNVQQTFDRLCISILEHPFNSELFNFSVLSHCTVVILAYNA